MSVINKLIGPLITPTIRAKCSPVMMCKRWKMKIPKPIDPTSPEYVPPTRWYEKRYHEPEYLDLLKPQIPFYELINVQVII